MMSAKYSGGRSWKESMEGTGKVVVVHGRASEIMEGSGSCGCIEVGGRFWNLWMIPEVLRKVLDGYGSVQERQL